MPPRKARTVRRSAEGNDLSPEAAVRLYLEYLANPDSFDNSTQVETLSKKAESTKDVLEKLALLRDARRARAGVGNEFRANFVRYAKDYADEQELVADDFRALGVPSAVLSEAGFITRGRGRRPRGEGTTRARSVGAGRSKDELAAIREWASTTGYKVSSRGRIAGDIIAAYEAAE